MGREGVIMLFKILAIIKDIEAIFNGNVGKRAKNRMKNRILNKTGFWKW